MYSWTHFFFQGYGNKTKLFVLLCPSGLLVGGWATALSPEFSAGFTNGRVQDCHLVEMTDIETICFQVTNGLALFGGFIHNSTKKYEIRD